MFSITHYLKKYNLVLSHFGTIICDNMINKSPCYTNDKEGFITNLEYYFDEYNEDIYNIYSDVDIFNIVDYLCGNIDAFYLN